MPTFVQPNLDAITKRRGANLPHWTQDHATYFVTFRLADAIPLAVMNDLLAERNALADNARTKRSEEAARDIERAFLARYHAYLDHGEGEAYMRTPAVADIVANSLIYFDADRYDLWAWCVMPNHVHVVVQPRIGHKLSTTIQGWKSFTSREINAHLLRRGQLWQHEPFDHLIRSHEHLEKFIRYTYDNPDKAKLSNWKWRWRTVA